MFKKGHIPYNKNKKGLQHHTEETKKAIRRFNIGKKRPLSEKAKKNMSESALKRKIIPPTQLGKKRSKTTKINLSLSHIGKQLGSNNPAWKGGISLIVNLIRSCQKYNEWRIKVFTRDDFTCQKCGIRGSGLEAHHKKAFKILIEEVKHYFPLLNLYDGAMLYTPLWDINNGETLCEDCHKNVKKGGK